ncbi:fibronectin type III domain-containing protein [Candidatus Woesearchaeota archaeon]|nr:fibronectin type III domain-containing protein [Candidatus Woesearchaeota archaeon]
MMRATKAVMKKIWMLLVLIVLLNLPLISALEISNVRVEDITETTAVIAWETDEPADSFVSYGTDKAALTKTGDANTITEHRFALNNLLPQTAYYYQVESNGVADDNSGNLFTFTTATPDTSAPELAVDFPAMIAGTKLDLSGQTEKGATVKLYIDDELAGSTVPEESGTFQFTAILLDPDTDNTVRVDAADAAGNKASAQGTIFADTKKPVITVEKLPDVTADNQLTLTATISEESSYEIFFNNKSIGTGEGKTISQLLQLKEGTNDIRIVVNDAAGWEVEEKFSIEADTQAPSVSATFEKGNEYFQGRAETSIHGKTEPGATVFLYVYRPIGYEYKPEFDKARAKVTADSKGEFTFDEVDFEEEPISLEKLAPKLVPSGLQETTIFPVQQLAEAQQFTYYVYIIAEDKTGKSDYWQQTVTVNTCFSQNFDFDVQSVARFQAPLRLHPQLVDEGREVVSAVFEFKYRGRGVPILDLATGKEIKTAFEIVGEPQFEPACTQSMKKNEEFKLGCQILPQSPRGKIPSINKDNWYITYNLHRAEELSGKKEDFWDELEKRQIVFPLKIRMSYQERDAAGMLGPTKTQTSCLDLSYFVDIPADSKDMLPDFLADEGLDSIESALKQINAVMPYLENAILITGVGCIGSFFGRMATRWARLFTSKAEFILTRSNPDKEKQCPSDQTNLYLRSTVEQWKDLLDKGALSGNDLPKDWDKNILDDKCPTTASLWKTEATLDQAYRWTCDRVFCRAVPARWTAGAEQSDVDTVISKQQGCTISSKGIPLQKVENCQEIIKQDVTSPSKRAAELTSQGAFTCFRNNDRFYVATTKDDELPEAYTDAGIFKLELIERIGISLEEKQKYLSAPQFLLVYQPPGSESYIVAQDKSCASACKNPRLPGYKADAAKGITSYNPEKPEEGLKTHGCYREQKQAGDTIALFGKGSEMKGSSYSAGYTNDCFFDLDNEGEPVQLTGQNTGLLQCVCTTDEKAKAKPQARTAIKEQNGIAEEWDYREAQLFKENGKGVDYPEWRYYGGRDFSSAFGADYLTDAFSKDKQVHEINPFTQHIGTFQTACFSGIRARLITLQAILQGMSNCIKEAKVTGLHDAGVCKTLFSQHVCGLIYKSIAYFASGCSPFSFDDAGKGEAVEDVGALVQAGFGSIPEAMQSSIDDIKSDYGNAKLNEFFATGAQGFAQSICMAAFGYDWPMDMDFILDSAYAFPTKTTTHVIPAEREFTTFNPATGNVIYNYEIGALVLPGCRIRSYDVYLKCVGPEDLTRPGVQCGPQGCDCLYATEPSSILEGQKLKYLEGGRGFNLKQGTFFEVPIPAPQKVDSPFRYDHVVVDLRIDPLEDPEKCFDEGYKDGKFYFPITDVSPPGAAVCQVQPLTGRYFCPEIVGLFGGEVSAYFEDPYMSCYDKTSESWMSCKTPNLFIKNDPIRIKPHIQTNGKGQCLKVTVNNLGPIPQEYWRKLPENLPGAFNPEVDLGTVTPEIFTGATSIIQLTQDSDPGCSAGIEYLVTPTLPPSPTIYAFTYSRDQNGLYQITLPAGVTVDGPYSVGVGNVLKDQTGKQSFTSPELQSVSFNMQGFKVRNLIRAPSGIRNACTYQISPAAGSGYAQKEKVISVTTELFEPDLSGQCFGATVPVRPPNYGRAQHQETIKLQFEKFEEKVIGQMHQEFLRGNCAFVQSNANGVINRKQNDLEEASAIYYSAACYVLQEKANWVSVFQEPVCTLMDIFFNRYYKVLQEKADAYPPEVTGTGEYQKIYQYLSEVNKRAGCGTSVAGGGASVSGTTAGTPPATGAAVTTCGFSETLNSFNQFKPSDWNQYTCRQPTPGELVSTSTLPGSQPQCWTRGMYSDQALAQQYNREWGCQGDLYCCPPQNQ